MSSIGIDLGAKNIVAAEPSEFGVRTIDIEDRRAMRSAVSFEPGDDEVIVGHLAADLLDTHPDLTISSVRRYVELDSEFTINDGSYTKTTYASEEIMALVLKKLRREVDDSLGESPDTAVISVPANFGATARSATKRAAEIAGFDAVRLAPKPSAVCAACGLGDRDDDTEHTVVYDFGDSFDISLVDTSYGDGSYDVIAIDGRRDLGDDFDRELSEWIIRKIESGTGETISGDRSKRRRVRQKVKMITERLSERESATFRDAGAIVDQSFEFTVTRERFAELTADPVDRSIECTRELLEKRGITPGDVDNVLLVGAVTKAPHVKDAVREFFGQEPAQGVDPDEAVATGAAGLADSVEKSDSPAIHRTPVRTAICTRLSSGDFDTILGGEGALPALEERTYATVENEQSALKLRVYRSTAEPPTPDTTELIGDLVFEGIPERPLGTEFTIQFKIDMEGTIAAAALPESVLNTDEKRLFHEVDAAVTDDLDLRGQTPDPREGSNVRRPLPDII